MQRYDFTLFIMDIGEWKEELTRLNLSREGAGRPYIFPDIIFILGGIIRCPYKIPYRGVEGFLRGLAKIADFLGAPDYTTIYRRCNALDLESYLADFIPVPDDPVIIAIDSTGIRIDNYSEWMRYKRGGKAKKRRGWIKVHAVVDAETHVPLIIKVTEESVGDQREFIPLVEGCPNSGYKIDRALADGIYDTRKIRLFIASHQIKPGIPPRKNVSPRSRDVLHVQRK